MHENTRPRPVASFPAARCPHVVMRDILGPTGTAALLDHVAAREDTFRPGGAWNRVSGTARIDRARRDCMVSHDLGACKTPLTAALAALAPPILQALQIDAPSVGKLEMELSSYGDGGHFNIHIDTLETKHDVRLATCVYYFAAEPRRFTGGALRLHAFPDRTGAHPPETVDIAPETDSLVAFPSWMRHEVLPVHLAGDTWRDRRFAVNCWIHRNP
jgi:Rps23 Pro-64 3,4-dihydroxylase Tpa1-like proline 4-hydroxylase